MSTVTWKMACSEEVGKIFIDRFEDEGFRFVILRGPGSLCAYIGIPETHPLAGFDYDSVPVDCHGGLTYAGKGPRGIDEGMWWYGWDYAHCDDRSFYDKDRRVFPNDKEWGVKDVDDDSWGTRYDFGKLMKLAASIAAKAASSKQEAGRE